MTAILEQLPAGARLTLIRLRSLGDCVLSTPAIRLLHEFRPDLRITVAVEPRFEAVFEGNPAVYGTIPPGLLTLRPRSSLVLNLHGGTTSMWMTASSMARWRAGFGHFRGQALYNIRIPRAQEILGEQRTVHTAEHVASAMFHLGVPRCEIPRASLYVKPAVRSRPYAVLHPFASEPGKTWPRERFAAVARQVLSSGLDPLVICAGHEQPPELGEVEIVRGRPLEEAIALIRGASLFVGNDSGPAHVAAACATPAVILFGESDPVVWAPWRAPESIQIVRSRIGEIEVAEVLAAVDQLKVRA